MSSEVRLTARTRDAELRFQLLGQLKVWADGGQIDLGSPKQRSVLAVLLLNANDIVPTDRIIDLVWGDSAPRTAEHSVQIYVSELRKALSNGSNADVIDTRPPGYVINVPPDAVDTMRFEKLVRDGLSALRAGEIGIARPKLEQALASWTGEPLADFTYEDFAQGHIRSLVELRSDALEAQAGLELDQGHVDKARELSRQAIVAYPLREEPRRLMMLALYRSGRQADALREYANFKRFVGEELGIEPSPALRSLEERVLLQDPTLDVAPAPVSEGNPYRGLRAFSEADADTYFGRESLVTEVREKLATTTGFVSIVGPSGSGKSSAAQAGLIPSLRAEGQSVALFQPGSRPLWELAGALDQIGYGSRAGLLRRFETNPSALLEIITRPTVLVVDQFEELFTLAEPDTAIRFSELMATAVRDPSTPLRVVTTLRADYYDRPLSMPALAGVFSDSVVSVKPMTPREIESAVVEPAGASGVSVEPSLLTQLVADMGDEPGALPLLQFTLFELFEHRSGSLTLADYQALGGIHGALTGGADELLVQFDDKGRDLVEQLMMRMIQKGRALSTSRPVPVRDLLDLGADNVALQGVLEAFGSRRLITFDRDASGAAIVEMAHEFLITEWPQMESWIETHNEDLDRIYAIDSAAREWVESEKSEDFLLRGARLDQFKDWRESTSLRLTSLESGFIDASLEMRSRELEARQEQAQKEAALQKSARRRLWYFGGAVAALATAVTFLVVTLIPEPPPDIVIMYDFENSEIGFSGLIGTGLNQAAGQLQLSVEELHDMTPAHVPLMQEHVANGTGLVLLQRATLFWVEEIHETIESHPETRFVWMDCDPAEVAGLGPNESCIVSQENELGFLAGVVAARATTTGMVGIVVGMNAEFMYPFHRGFVAGASIADPNVNVLSVYLSFEPDDGFGSWTLGRLAGQELIAEGADVIFHAAAYSGWGVAEAASLATRPGGPLVWVIGVDEDMAMETESFGSDYVLGFKDILLTSIVKRIDLGVSEAIDQFAMTGSVETIYLDIAGGGIDYVTTGGHLGGLTAELEVLKESIRNGEFEVGDDAEIEVRMLLDLITP